LRLVIQRVSHAKVEVENKTVGEIGKGALVFFAAHKDDVEDQVGWLANKLINLRMFADEEGKMNLSLLDTNAEVLIVSQFTLYSDCKEGRRPSFTQSADPIIAKKLYNNFIFEVKNKIKKVDSGIFAADMQVHLINDGPVTFIIDAKI
jgi:D-tyrosyl-tRNA(Tyr) deacylase